MEIAVIIDIKVQVCIRCLYIMQISIIIDVQAEAIQADSFKPAKDDNGHIKGWSYSDGETVKAETYEAETKLPVAEQGENHPE